MYAKCFKRVMDFTLSLIALVILSPVLLILTVMGFSFRGVMILGDRKMFQIWVCRWV